MLHELFAFETVLDFFHDLNVSNQLFIRMISLFVFSQEGKYLVPAKSFHMETGHDSRLKGECVADANRVAPFDIRRRVGFGEHGAQFDDD